MRLLNRQFTSVSTSLRQRHRQMLFDLLCCTLIITADVYFKISVGMLYSRRSASLSAFCKSPTAFFPPLFCANAAQPMDSLTAYAFQAPLRAPYILHCLVYNGTLMAIMQFKIHAITDN